jgi:hypothetical protein
VCFYAGIKLNRLQGWTATNQVPRPQGIALKLVENALQGCSQGVAMQYIQRIDGMHERQIRISLMNLI